MKHLERGLLSLTNLRRLELDLMFNLQEENYENFMGFLTHSIRKFCKMEFLNLRYLLCNNLEIEKAYVFEKYRGIVE